MGTTSMVLLVFCLTYLMLGVIVLILMLHCNPGFLNKDTPDATPPVLFGTAAVMLWWLILYYLVSEIRSGGDEDV